MAQPPGTHRVLLTDEALHWIVLALRSAARAKKQSAARVIFLSDLADRLTEMMPGNPNMTLKGRL